MPTSRSSLKGWLWFLVNALGVPVSLVLGSLLWVELWEPRGFAPGTEILWMPPYPLAWTAVEGLAVGLIVGLGESIILRRVVKPGWWLLVCCVGWTAGLVLLEMLRELWFHDFGNLNLQMTAGALAALIVGLLQWLVLRRAFWNANWWILAMLVSGLLSFWLISPGVPRSGLWWGIGIPPGALTAPLIVWLLRHPRAPLQTQEAVAAAR